MSEEQQLLEAFEVSAPGKVILHGEHSVVYGKPAIAGPIGLRTYLTYKRLPTQEIFFDFASIPFESSLSLESFNAFLRQYDCYTDLQPLDFLQKLRASEEFLFANFVTKQPTKDSIKEKFSLGTALYLLNRILHNEGIASLSNGFRLTLKSAMSIGAGLGSSAGYGVCVSAGAYLISRIAKGELNRSSVDENFSPDVLKKISQWAFDSEIVMHERPSGIDNTICTYGNLIKFKRGERFESLNLRQQVNILIVDTGVSRTTAKLVANVAELKTRHAKLMDSVLEAMGHLVDDVVGILEDERDRFDELCTLVSINNNLLRAIGVSHPSLEKIFQIAERSGFNAKLTGAGGGGCALVFLPSDFESRKEFAELCDNLTEAGFSWTRTTIGGEGVELKLLE